MDNPLTKISEILQAKGKKAKTHTVTPDVSVTDAVDAMNQQRIGSIVVEQDGHVVGIFTERDVLVRIVGESRNPNTTPVSDVMTRDPLCVTGATLVRDAMSTATDKRCRHFPVVEDNRLVGMISVGDLVKWETREHQAQLNAAILAVRAASGR